MKQFFRLLLISFGLLLLLGLNYKKSGESDAVLTESYALTHPKLSACLPASSANDAETFLTAPAMKQVPGHKREAVIQHEQNISTRIHTHILSSRDRYMEFCPGNQMKTGYAMHLSVQRGDPPMA